ncbi:MAG: LemA family protein [Erysipelotrichaceae bacterium]|nr:LemA family protein [Erysipelotrichaceae bacterium]
MKFWENRNLTKLIMIIMIIIAVLFGSYKTLSSMRNDTLDIFYQGVDNDGYGIQNDLDRVIDSSSRLISLANLYVRNNDQTLVNETITTQQELVFAKNVDDKYVAYQKLDQQLSLLYYALDNYQLTDVHKITTRTLYYDISEAKDKIGHNQFNTYVDQYNAKLTKFPANVLSKITFVGELPAFR